jgi:Fur family transcriptional regulator, ferric uptake regulator
MGARAARSAAGKAHERRASRYDSGNRSHNLPGADLTTTTRRKTNPRPDEAAALHGAVDGALSQHGARYTAHRRTLVTALRRAGQPLTIPQLVAAASTVPQSSVYRNLAVLDEAGVVHRMPGPDDFARYELAEELMGHHHHLVCSRCGAVEDVELPAETEAELERVLHRIAGERGFTLAAHRLDLVGGCESCA